MACTDFFYESLLKYIKQNPFNFFRAVSTLFTKGKALLKAQICEAVEIDVALIPYNSELISWLKERKKLGHQIVLATATHENIAQKVSNHLGFFDQVLATDENINLKGASKQKKLIELFGEKQFTYVGDSQADLKVWRSAKTAAIVSPTEKLVKQVKAIVDVERIFTKKKDFTIIFKAIRLHQWVKNTLLFVPLFTSHNFDNVELLIKIVVAFFTFSLCASGVYIFNDLLDLEDDRQHRTKSTRPFASGQLSIINGVVIALCCLVTSLILSFYLGDKFLFLLLVYFLTTLLYSLYFKFIVMLDIVVLAGLYTVRIIAGAFAIDVVLSSWLLAFSMFIFLSLAIMKRYTELYGLTQQGQNNQNSRGYVVTDMNMLAILGSACGYISVLVMALFINSLTESNLYTKPGLLWWVCPFLLFWIGRIWLLAGRGEVDDDPIHYVIKDKPSWLLAIVVIALFLSAI